MYCILITGIPASGKSTIADEISKRLSLPVLSKDRFKEVLFDTIGFESRQEKVRLGTAAMEIMYHAASQLMKAQIPFILENNFEYASRKGLDRLLSQSDCPALTITLTGDYETLYRRFLQRNAGPGRHRGHIVNDCYPEKRIRSTEELLKDTIPLDQFVEGIHARGFDRFVGGQDQIVIDTTEFSKVDVDALISQIEVWRDGIKTCSEHEV